VGGRRTCGPHRGPPRWKRVNKISGIK